MLAASAPQKKIALPDISSVELENDDIYMTPKEVRKGLQAVMTKYSCTQAEIARQCGVASGPVGRFLKATGEFGGEAQDMYRYGYVFLEKLRIKDGAKKSKKRKAIEEETAPGKKPFLGQSGEGKFWVAPGMSLIKTKDSLGRTVINTGW